MNVILMAIAPAVALLIFIGVWQAFRASPLAENGFVLAVGVTALCLLGIFRHAGALHQGPAADQSGRDGLIDVVLLPYAAVGISIVFVLLLVGLARIIGPDLKRLSYMEKKGKEQRMKGQLVGGRGSRRNVKKARPSSIRKI